MKKKIIFITSLLLLVSCSPQEILPNRIYYFRDERTNLCYAGMVTSNRSSHDVVSFTCVPCSKSVLELIGHNIGY